MSDLEHYLDHYDTWLQLSADTISADICRCFVLDDRDVVDYVKHIVVSNKKIFSQWTDYFLGTFKLGIEGIRGHTFGAEKLTPSQRVLYVLSSIMGALTYAFGVYAVSAQDPHYGLYAAGANIGSWTTFAVAKAPQYSIIVREYAEKYDMPLLISLCTMFDRLIFRTPPEELKKIDDIIHEKDA